MKGILKRIAFVLAFVMATECMSSGTLTMAGELFESVVNSVENLQKNDEVLSGSSVVNDDESVVENEGIEEISETTTEEVTINISQLEDDEINTDDIPDGILVLLNDGQMYENLNGYEKNGLNMYLGVREDTMSQLRDRGYDIRHSISIAVIMQQMEINVDQAFEMIRNFGSLKKAKKSAEEFAVANLDSNYIEQESVKESSEKEIITGNLEDDFYYIAGELENASNKLVYLVPREIFLKENRKILQHILEMVLLVIGFTVCTMLYFSRRLARPLVEVAQTLEKAPNGMAVLEEPRGSFQEMSKFVSCYNQARKKIEELLEKVERESRLKEKAHYEMLMSQISPHFIFNTVNSIRIMAIKEGQDRAGENENTEKALEALGDILHAVYSNKNGMTTVGQETALLKAYVDIMQMRFGSSFQYYNVIPTELFYYEIPAFTMQPIVENAILHGVKGVTAGQIIVSAIEYENDFVISVFNNGNSADKKKIEDLLKGEKNQRAVTGIGLYNVNSRLKLLYGESYGLIYNEKVRNGFEIWIRLPKKITESEER